MSTIKENWNFEHERKEDRTVLFVCSWNIELCEGYVFTDISFSWMRAQIKGVYREELWLQCFLAFFPRQLLTYHNVLFWKPVENSLIVDRKLKQGTHPSVLNLINIFVNNNYKMWYNNPPWDIRCVVNCSSQLLLALARLVPNRCYGVINSWGNVLLPPQAGYIHESFLDFDWHESQFKKFLKSVNFLTG